MVSVVYQVKKISYKAMKIKTILTTLLITTSVDAAWTNSKIGMYEILNLSDSKIINTVVDSNLTGGYATGGSYIITTIYAQGNYYRCINRMISEPDKNE